MPFLHYIESGFMGAAFSERTNTYFKNTKTEAFLSCLMPLAVCLFVSLVLCGITTCQYYPTRLLYIPYLEYVVIVASIALPKFLVFFGLTWLLCKWVKQTEYFCAFVAANNWVYFPYLLIYSAKIFLGTYVDIPHPLVFVYATSFYMALIVFFLAHNVLRLVSEVAWLPAFFIFVAHGLIKWITTKNGMFLVF